MYTGVFRITNHERQLVDDNENVLTIVVACAFGFILGWNVIIVDIIGIHLFGTDWRASSWHILIANSLFVGAMVAIAYINDRDSPRPVVDCVAASALSIPGMITTLIVATSYYSISAVRQSAAACVVGIAVFYIMTYIKHKKIKNR